MEVFVGNPMVNVSIVAKPWSEGHVARISSARVCGQMVSNHYSNKDDQTCFSFRLPSKEHIELTE